VSLLTGIRVRSDVAMTGEVTLRGRVLPVGGIKEKILAAVSRGMKKVLIPAQNKKDLAEIPDELRKRIIIKTIERVEDIWPLARSK
jgi:ATP-dependent Lon protease